MWKKLIGLAVAWLVILGGVTLFIHHRQTPSATTSQTSKKLQIVTTNSILADMVTNIGKDHVSVYSIVKRGTDPHEYEPRPLDVSKTAAADVVFHNGLNLETGGSGWFTKLVKTANKSFGTDVFAASQTVTPKYLTTNAKETDPHAWLDLANGIKYVQAMTKVLVKQDPANASDYRKNARQYIAKLQQLHQRAQTTFKNIPADQRLLVTSEGAFKYFAAAYHIKAAYIWEINSESQGSPAQMQAVIKKVDQSAVLSLFVESSVTPKSMQKVASATNRPIYAKLFTDSLAKKGTTGDTYYTMMQWNLTQIQNGLKGN